MAVDSTHLSVSIDSPGESVCKPVQSDRLQDLIWRERVIDPFTELLANPVCVRFVCNLGSDEYNSPRQKGYRTRRDNVANGTRPGAVFSRIT
jgi:hypothetical protein